MFTCRISDHLQVDNQLIDQGGTRLQASAISLCDPEVAKGIRISHAAEFHLDKRGM
jgi:hypothetical protein